MKHTLINLNQEVRAYGVSLCNDPMDPHHHLGMKIQDTFIPFTMVGTTCHFTTRTPISWEMDKLSTLGDNLDTEWNSSVPHFLQDSEDLSGDLLETSVSANNTRHRRPDVEPSELAKQWGIELEQLPRHSRLLLKQVFDMQFTP